MSIRIVFALILGSLLFSGCDTPEDKGAVPPSLLLKSTPSLLGITFRPPGRVTDIKRYGWEPRSSRHPDRLWFFLNSDSPVVAIAPGRVVYADNQGKGGRQYLVAILHSPRVKSVISGLEELSIEEGSVLKGDAVIGKASGILFVQLYLRRKPGLHSRKLNDRPVWSPVFSAPYILGKGGNHARTVH